MTVRAQLQGMALLLLFFTLFSWGVRQYYFAQSQVATEALEQIYEVRGFAQRIGVLELGGTPDDGLYPLAETAVQRAVTALGGSAEASALTSAWSGFREAARSARSGSAQRSALIQSQDALYEASNRAIVQLRRAAEESSTRLGVFQVALAVVQIVLVLLLWLLAQRISSALSQTVATLASTSRQLTVTVEEQERVASQQATATTETSTTMEELAASFRMSAEQAEQASGETRQVLGLSREGSSQVDQALHALTELRSRVDEISTHILRLSEQVGQIASLNRLVGDLSAQTNMLALNAAVEAARAGDAGRGFAVVAAEIRKLADESRRSAERVARLVSEIQGATHTTVLATEAGTRTVERTVNVAGDTATVFQRVADSVNSAYDSVQQISLNLRQQSEAVNQVVLAMNSLRNGARDSAAGLAQTRQATLTLDGAASSLEAMVRRPAGS